METFDGGQEIEFVPISATVLGSASAIALLLILAMCGCCVRGKKQYSAPYMPSSLKLPRVENEELDTHDANTEHKRSPGPSVLTDNETLPPVTAAPLTVIIPDQKHDAKMEAKPSQQREKPPGAVRFDDPAYRTLGKDMDDPFSMTKSAQRPAGKAKGDHAVSAEKLSKEVVPLPKPSVIAAKSNDIHSITVRP